MTNINKLYIITGSAKVGKSTISNKLAESLSKSVLIEGDTIYNFFITEKRFKSPIRLLNERKMYCIIKKTYLM